VRSKLLMVLLVLAMLIMAVFPFGEVLSNLSIGKPSDVVASSLVYRPIMNISADVDKNHNRIEDSLDSEISVKQQMSSVANDDYVNVTVLLKSEPSVEDTAVFISSGGILTTGLWTDAVYGFGGRIPYNGIEALAAQCSDVLLIEKDAVCNATVAYAAQQVGARPYVWSTLGLQGDPNSSLAVLDTGIDASHVNLAPGFGSRDFSKKIVGWNDQVTSATAPFDDNGHGSHCSGLAAGDGFFSVDSSGYATATWSANLGAVSTTGTYFISGMMVNNSGPITLKVKWATTGTAQLSALPLLYGGKTISSGSWNQVASVSTPSQNTWYTLTYNVASVPSGGYDMYHPDLTLTTGTGNLYVEFTMSWPYSPPADGFSAWTGLAPQSKLVGVKVLDSSGSGTSSGLISGINWVIANRVAYHITVASLSLGFSAEQSSVDSAIVNLVNSGVSTIVAAGNSGSGANYIYTPGSVDEALTVAAMNQFDGIASYSSQGGTSRYRSATMKPDVTAPGGSFYAVPLFSADSNYNDADGGFSDAVANDAAPMQGTSMATPVVAGAVQVLVQALGGSAGWNYTRSQALMPKMLLLMTATETYPNVRESGTSPTLQRGGKDAQEGFGRVNVDAAADSVLKSYMTGTTVVDSLGVPPKLTDISVLGQRLCWARNVQLSNGTAYNFSLNVPAGADFDLYLYNTTGTAYGEPVILSNSTSAVAGGKESLMYTPVLSGEYYIVVKRATETTGGGQFTLASTPSQTAHLLLSVEPAQSGYVRGQSLTLKVTVLNQLNPALDSTLALTITGPGGYYHYDFEPVAVGADEVKDFSFGWGVPDVGGTFDVEVGLVSAQSTAYDAVFLSVR
jgi:subtilisin family serine protease